MNKLLEFLNWANSKGFPIPLLRDPKTQIGSISFTFLWLSGTIIMLGLLGKWTKFLDIDLTNALTFFGVCSGLYFGRNLGPSNSKTNEKVDNE